MDRAKTSKMSILCLLLCFPIFCCAFDNKSLATDQSALLALKSSVTWDSSSGNLLSNWNEETSVCSWIGVVCSSLHNRVVALNMSHLGLQGTIPPQIGNLSFINSIDISSNVFRGQLPQEMAKLRRLKFINCSVNNITGDVPGWLGSLPDLKYLNLGNNIFSGSLPSSFFNSTKLEFLRLHVNHLNGDLPEEIGNLGNLRFLDMYYNQLKGSLPSSILNLSSLQVIDFTGNRLNGYLPLDICSKFPNLLEIRLSENQFSGQIQSRFDNCSDQLTDVSLGTNHFEGPIPRNIVNLTRLVSLNLYENRFQGPIPTEIGNLQRLLDLDLSYNCLSGPIPPSIFNLLSLSTLVLSFNNLTGSLPLDIGQILPNLERLSITNTRLSGVVPNSISNLTRLHVVELSKNQLTGSLPTSIGSLRFLEVFYAYENFLTVDLSAGFDFLASLSHCRSLTSLFIHKNPLNFPLSPSIGNFSSSLRHFSMGFSGIIGNIPHEIGNLSGLLSVWLEYNNLTGLLPLSIQKLTNLQLLQLESNQITGFIPNVLCNMRKLFYLDLASNKFYGQVPKCFWSMTSLGNLLLGSNRLNSTLPTELGNLRDLLVLDLHSNSLSGNITPAIGSIRAATSIDLSENNFSGSIPESIGGLSNLIQLLLNDNQLQGPIPETFRNMLSLQDLNISYNNLTGEIPASLEKLSDLKIFDVSFNHLRGRIPSNGPFLKFRHEYFMSNDALCGGIPDLHFPSCTAKSLEEGAKKKKLQIIAYSLISTAVMVILITVILIMFIIRQKKKKPGTLAQLELAPPLMHQRVSYYEIQGATDGFSDSNLLGIGGFGRVYKGVFNDGTVLAIKVFNLQLEAAFRSFETECQVISSIRHRNLVKIISSCSSLDFKALILEYMPNGSLEKWLYCHNHFLDFWQRLNIMIDVATALDYLHHGYTSPIVHCDLKPSNILLDEQMVGHLSDFGISKLLGGGENMVQTMTVATIGYTAPEYGSEGLVSTSCDIYSFGILLMETFSRKKPTDEMFGEEWGLKDMIMDGLHNSTADFIDQNLLASEDKILKIKVKCIVSIMELALKCSVESPKKRIDASHVLAELQKTKLIFLPNS